jgi:hypothetical protein
MLPKLLALSAVMLCGALLAVATSKAQETGSTATVGISTVADGTTATVGGETITVPPDVTVELPPTHPPADMTLSEFRERRVHLRQKTNEIRYRKGYHPVHKFRLQHREVKPWLRAENLAYWRSKVDQAQSWRIVGWHGHRWRWYEGKPARGWGFYERASIIGRYVFGSSAASWTIGCSRSEGHGMMVWNGGYFDPFLRYYPGPGPGGASTAYGPMQFMYSTMMGSVDGAFSIARHRGVRHLPNRYKHWNSNIGQFLTAAYMYTKGGTGHWTGASC